VDRQHDPCSRNSRDYQHEASNDADTTRRKPVVLRICASRW
jgi:hypothetical protein